MKIHNTSRFPTYFVRRMLAWCMKETEVTRDQLRTIKFRKRAETQWSGRAYWSGRVVVSIGDAGFPCPWNGYKRACKPQDGSDYLVIADATEALVMTTAHELGHIAHFRRGHTGRGSEDLADARARKVIRTFRESRDTLLALWSVSEPERPKASIQEQRAQAAADMLAAWERRFKLAKTKIAKYRRKARYYERVAAMKA